MKKLMQAAYDRWQLSVGNRRNKAHSPIFSRALGRVTTTGRGGEARQLLTRLDRIALCIPS